MNKRTLLLFLICFTCTIPTFGQSSFEESYIKFDPVHPDSNLAPEERLKVHQHFLAKVKQNKDSIKQIYGLLYLHLDYFDLENYPESIRALLEAEKIAQAANNPVWQGWVSHRRGALYVQLRKFKEALQQYETATTQCGIGRDSQCVAMSLEQIASMYAQTGEYEKAHQYFQLAMPVIEKYCGEDALSVALSNYGILLAFQQRPVEALPLLRRSLALSTKLGHSFRAAQCRNNLAEVYTMAQDYDKALPLYQSCIQTNEENKRYRLLIYNYEGISTLYEKMGNLRGALDYWKKYKNVEDSIIGAQTQEKIADLETKYKSQQKELALKKSQEELLSAKRSQEHLAGLLLLGLMLTVFGLWRWQDQRRQSKIKLTQKQEHLNSLTKILVEKNTMLADLEKQVSEFTANRNITANPEDFEDNLYNQRILTDTDWASFKIYFEQSFPGYLQRLRNTHPNLTEAEERLFLLIKLNLSTKEIAGMLGISTHSVKKTRNRLRKRLELEEETDLFGFIQQF